jgi:8-oxo-dGTP diphosphatase
MKALEVAAGLVFHEGSLLLAQRFAQDHLGGLWEFPGGKRERGETFPACLQRELWEELGVHVRVGKLYETIAHTYPERRVLLLFYVCSLLRGEPTPMGCQAIRWVKRTDLDQFAFPAADARLIAKLRADLVLWNQPHQP